MSVELIRSSLCLPIGPFYKYVLSLILAWINNYIPYKVWIKLHIHSQASTVAPNESICGPSSDEYRQVSNISRTLVGN